MISSTEECSGLCFSLKATTKVYVYIFTRSGFRTCLFFQQKGVRAMLILPTKGVSVYVLALRLQQKRVRYICLYLHQKWIQSMFILSSEEGFSSMPILSLRGGDSKGSRLQVEIFFNKGNLTATQRP